MLRQHVRKVTAGLLALGMAGLMLASCAPAAAPKPTGAAPTAAPATAAPKPAGAVSPAAASPAASPKPSAAAAPAVDTQRAAEQFRGKTITFTVGFAPGGGYDTFARLVAVHMGRHVPGNPEIAVTNMPGANSALAVQSVMRKTPGTGLDVVIFNGGLVIQELLGQKVEGFSKDTPIYLGVPDAAPVKSQLCVRSELAANAETFMKSPRKLKIGETGPQIGPGATKEWFKIAGLPVEVVYGYGGTSEIRAAFQRGELDLTDRCSDTDLSFVRQMIDENQLVPLFYWDAAPNYIKPLLAQGKYPWYKQVFEIVQVSPTQRQALEVSLKLSRGQRTFAIAPQTPENTVNALRKAFEDTVADPAFQADVEAREYDWGFRSDAEIKALFSEIDKLSPDVFEILKMMWIPPGA